MCQPNSDITGWIYYTTPDTKGIAWDEAAAQLAAYVNHKDYVEYKQHARCFRRFSSDYPTVLKNHEGLPLTVSKTGRRLFHVPVMPLALFASKKKLSPGNARIVYAEGIYDTFDIIYHDETKTKHQRATFYPYSMAEKKPSSWTIVSARGYRGAISSPVAAASPPAAPETNTANTLGTSANRFAGLATRADNIL